MMLGWGEQERSTAMSNKSSLTVATMGIDIGKYAFHVVGLDRRGAIVLRQKWSRGQVEARLANMPPCLIGMEACVGAHHLSRRLHSQGHDARLMPAKYVRPYSKGQKNDFRDAEQGILAAPGNPCQLSDIASIADSGARIAQRPAGAGAQLLLLALLGRAGIAADELAFVKPVCPSGPDIAQAIRSGRADRGIATRSVARAAGLEFLPVTWEHFDLVLRQRDYFLPGPQALFAFTRLPTMRERASELGG
jgi:PBP superfamily domain